MDPQIRIRTKILWIRNTAFQSFGFRFFVNKNTFKKLGEDKQIKIFR
jgi:hypothetical protein